MYNDSTLLGMEQQMNQMRLNNAFNALGPRKHMKEIYKMRKNNDQDGLMDLQDSLIAQAEDSGCQGTGVQVYSRAGEGLYYHGWYSAFGRCIYRIR